MKTIGAGVVALSLMAGMTSGGAQDRKAEDCIPIDQASLKIVDQGLPGWLLSDAKSRLAMLDNQDDARAALEIARKYSSLCFIGRSNKRPNRKDYLLQYWK